MIYLLPPDLTQRELDEVLDEVTYLYQERQISSMLLIDNSYYKEIN